MLHALTLLLLLQLAGEVIVRLADLPLPGPVVGMALLFAGLVIRGRVTGNDDPPAALEQTTAGLLRHLSLLFVPAGVGVVTLLGVIEREWQPILAALVVSTLVTIAVTALALRALDRLAGRTGDPDAAPGGDGDPS
jgi:holin-like protein